MAKNHTEACNRRATQSAWENLRDWYNGETDPNLRAYIERKTVAEIIKEGQLYREDGTMTCECTYPNGFKDGAIVRESNEIAVTFFADSNNKMLYLIEVFNSGDSEWIQEIDGDFKCESAQDHTFSNLDFAVEYAVENILAMSV